MLKDILLTFLGFCGALCIEKIQERDSAMMQIKFQLIDELIAIDERLHADFAAGKISDDFKLMAMRFEFHLRAYCKSRKFHYFSNKKILKQWAEFTKLFRFDNSTQDASIGLAHITIYELLQLLY